MSVLPEPPATTIGQATNPLTESVMQAAVRDLITQTSYRNPDPDVPSHKDGPRVGDTPPVVQPDSRLVPQWALGVAVASIGVGAGTTFIGCGAWLLFKGLSMVSVPGLERFAWIIIAPFAGAAMLATAVGGVISKAKRAVALEIHNHNGPEYHEHEHHTDSSRSIVRTEKTINRH